MHALAARVAWGLLLLGVLAAAVGCGKNPAEPSPVPPVSNPALGIQIAGTTALSHPGETSQLSAVVRFSDGTTKNMADAVRWSGGTGLVTINGGLLKAVAYGRGEITAAYGFTTASAAVRVLPDGAFLLYGRVEELDGYQLVQARVESSSGIGTSSTLTSESGAFVLPGAGPVTLRVEKYGYEAAVRQLTVERDEEVNFQLRQLDTMGTIRGTYTLTITASPSCTLPPDVVQRTYAAEIEEGRMGATFADLVVFVAGADLIWPWGGRSRFDGWLDGKTIRFDHDGDYLLVERLASNTALRYTGTAVGTVSDRAIITTFSGGFTLVSLSPSSILAQCWASDHRLELVR